MARYGQYCPISRTSEILAERWTPLIIRNLLLGCTTFNTIAGGVPGMSRSLLSQRLRALEGHGIVVSEAKQGRRGREYRLTPAGLALWDVIEPMAAWGAAWIDLQPEHSDPSFVLWAWAHVHLRRDKLPSKRVVVRFEFPEQPPPYRRFWFLVEGGQLELCYAPPGHDADLEVVARNEAFTRWHVGQLSWQAALRAGDIEVSGPRALARQLPTWNDGKAGSGS